jgi:pantetheine-phosphate adenylyltransferase
MTDFDFELQMAQANKTISSKVETVFMATDPSLSYISSSMVKEFAAYGKSVKDLVPEIILRKVEEKYNIL